MLKRLAIASLLAGSLALPALAQRNPAFRGEDGLQLELRRGDQLNAVSGVESSRPAGAVIVTDALYGGLAGALIGGGVSLIQGADYARNITIGAGVGILVGAVVGVVDVTGRPDTVLHPEGTPVMERALKYRGRF
jgi:hypothetical protein